MERNALRRNQAPLSPIEVLWIARFDYEPAESLQRHRHPFYQLMYVIGGNGRAEVDGQEFELTKGSFILAIPGHMHGLVASTDEQLQTYDTKFAVHDTSLKSDLELVPGCSVDEHGSIGRLMESLHQEGEQGRRWNRIVCDAILSQVAVDLIRAATPGEASAELDPLSLDVTDRAVKQAMSFIAANYMQDITIDTIAGDAGFSRQHLAKIFHDACESTPHDYLLRYRIQKAKELLRLTSLPIKHITQEVGFRSLHHFTRAFRSIVGTPPGQWRKIEANAIRKDIKVAPEFVNVYVLPPRYPGGKPEVRVAGSGGRSGSGGEPKTSNASVSHTLR